MRFLSSLLFLSLAVPAFAQVTKQERAGIVNFSKVDAVVACGGATDTSALEGLKADGFKTIISLRTATEQGANLEQNAARAKELGLKYVSIPFSVQQPDPKAVDVFLGEIANKSNQPVYVHCVGGRHRTGVMTAIYRMTVDKWTADQAFNEMKQYKYGATFLHPEFKAFVFDYPAMLARSAATAIAGSDTSKQH